VVGAALLVGLAFGIVYLVAGGGDDSNSFSVSQGDCVKRSGEAAVKADCSDASSFQVVSIVDDKGKCGDVKQPYVVNPTSDGKTQVLCLKPHS
jgi:collagen type III alpha